MDIEEILRGEARDEILRIARYCQNLAGNRPMARRSELSLHDMLWVLPHAFLIEVLADEDDYQFTLYGDQMRRMYGADFTGLKLSTVGNENLRNLLRATYNAVVATQTPQYLRGKYEWPTQEIGIERLLIPLADDKDRLATILGVVYADIPDAELARFAGVGPALFIPEYQSQRQEKRRAAG